MLRKLGFQEGRRTLVGKRRPVWLVREDFDTSQREKEQFAYQGGPAMSHITRRALLRLSATGAAAARTGGLAAILATRKAPAFAQAAIVHWLRWNDFVPVSDQLLRKEIAAECQKALGIKLNIETINGNDIQARVT